MEKPFQNIREQLYEQYDRIVTAIRGTPNQTLHNQSNRRVSTSVVDYLDANYYRQKYVKPILFLLYPIVFFILFRYQATWISQHLGGWFLMYIIWIVFGVAITLLTPYKAWEDDSSRKFLQLLYIISLLTFGTFAAIWMADGHNHAHLFESYHIVSYDTDLVLGEPHTMRFSEKGKKMYQIKSNDSGRPVRELRVGQRLWIRSAEGLHYQILSGNRYININNRYTYFDVMQSGTLIFKINKNPRDAGLSYGVTERNF